MHKNQQWNQFPFSHTCGYQSNHTSPIEIRRHKLLWMESWVWCIVDWYDLYGFVDETLSCPPSIASGFSIPNLDCIFWIIQYILPLSVILASFSNYAHCFVAAAKSSQTIWQKLAHTFAKLSLSWLMLICEHLFKPQGPCSLMTTYMTFVVQ